MRNVNDHMKEAYDLLVTQLKDDLKKAYVEQDWNRDRSTFRERAYADYIYKKLGKRSLLEACELVDMADKEYSGQDSGCREWAECDYPDDNTMRAEK